MQLSFDEAQELKVHISELNVFCETIQNTLNDSNTDVIGRYSSYRMMAQMYNDFAEQSKKYLTIPTAIRTFNMDKMPRSGDAFWSEERAILETALLNAKLLLASLESSSASESSPKFYDLVEQIPEVKKAFHNSSGTGLNVIFNREEFINWKSAIKRELFNLKSDPLVQETIRALDRFKGWTDTRLFDEVSANCRIIRDNYQEYEIRDSERGHIIMDKKKVFIVHGHDTETRNEVELFLHRLKLEPIILSNEASRGQTIIEKFEEYSDVSFAIVLYTACDEGRVKGTEEFRDRARQNVIFEHGYFCAKLGRGSVVALHEPGVEIPSDLSGVLYISLDGDWKTQVKREMRAAGIDSDWTKG